MHEFGETAYRKRNFAGYVQAACIAALLGPSLIVWILRGAAYALPCAPGPDVCRSPLLGEGLRDALSISWALPNNSLLLITIAIGATVAGFFMRRPLSAALCLLVLPIAALLAPMFAVRSAMYPGCSVNIDGVGDCMLWGTRMGMSFHTAAAVPAMIYDLAPYSFSLAIMLGLLGWFFTQPRAARPHAMARMRRLDDR